MKNTLFIFLFSTLAFSDLSYSQDSVIHELQFEVNRVYPMISITNEELNEVNVIADLNNDLNKLELYYKPSWVREYISVEVFASHNGSKKKASSKNDTFTDEQKKLMKMADPASDISVHIQYIPENSLSQNEPRKLDFTFPIEPESEAKYTGGKQPLHQYLKEKVMDNIPAGSFVNYDLTAVKFTVNEAGEIVNAHIFESPYQTYKNEKVNQLLLEAVRNMPCWKPAAYANGLNVKQEFVLTVGNMQSCLIPVLNIHRD